MSSQVIPDWRGDQKLSFDMRRFRPKPLLFDPRSSASICGKGFPLRVRSLALTLSNGWLKVALFVIQTGRAENVKDALNHKYKNQILALRSPFTAGDQKFDSAGQPLNSRPKGPWLLYGGIFVEKLNLSSGTLRLEGHRAASYDDKKNGKLMLIRYGKARRIEIHLDQPINSFDDAQTVLNRD